jgi:hypothetical protein
LQQNAYHQQHQKQHPDSKRSTDSCRQHRNHQQRKQHPNSKRSTDSCRQHWNHQQRKQHPDSKCSTDSCRQHRNHSDNGKRSTDSCRQHCNTTYQTGRQPAKQIAENIPMASAATDHSCRQHWHSRTNRKKSMASTALPVGSMHTTTGETNQISTCNGKRGVTHRQHCNERYRRQPGKQIKAMTMASTMPETTGEQIDTRCNRCNEANRQ